MSHGIFQFSATASEKNNSNESYQRKWTSPADRPYSAESIASSTISNAFLNINITSSSSAESDTLVIFVTEEQVKQKSFVGFDQLSKSFSFVSLNLGDFTGDAKSKLVLYSFSTEGSSFARLLLVGLGKSKKVDIDTFRVATDTAMKLLISLKQKSAIISIPEPSVFSDRLNTSSFDVNVIDAISRTAILSNHIFDKYLSRTKVKSKSPLTQLYLLKDAAPASLQKQLQEVVVKASNVAMGTVLARELANDRADVVTPEYMEKIALDLSRTHQLKFNVLQQPELIEKGYHLINAVGQAAKSPPRIVTLYYQGDPSNTGTEIALVGKGITFDSGGLNLKSTGFIEDMHLDMGGSACVLGAAKAIAMNKPKVNAVFVFALAENAIGSAAFKPHQIIMSKKGSVEINSTDAEGRLVLADAISYVQSAFAPKQIIDFATLTGACVVALGECLAGVFSNDNEMANDLKVSGDRTFERVWHLPIIKEHRDELNGTYSDLRNTGKKRYGGASTGAAFIEKYVEDGVKWAHVDIAGPGMYSSARDFMPVGGTGFGTQLIVDYVESKCVDDGKK
jgi:leucyl aminopeptidase